MTSHISYSKLKYFVIFFVAIILQLLVRFISGLQKLLYNARNTLPFLPMFIPRDILINFSFAAVILISVFIVFQFISLAQLGYIINNDLYNDGSQFVNQIFLIIISVILFGAGLAMEISCFYYGKGHIHSIWTAIVNIVLAIAYTVLSILWIEGCILTCAIIFCVFSIWTFVVFVMFTNLIVPSWVEVFIYIVQDLSLIITIMVFSSTDISVSALFSGASSGESIDQGLDILSEEESWDKNTSDQPEPNVPYKMWYFHFLLTLSCCCFVFGTGINLPFSPLQRQIGAVTLDAGTIAAAIIFIWTLLATRLFPERDFGVPNSSREALIA
ncbi:hypothetical protein ADUPG1_013575 [Aduncisulcus paluster]|uniref:Uncharacterized protein n=1 Tax=Aduncisulcus paluster TaxID=2918883 RepID=A0ABQ5K3G1_9EUKA|nr:hypothetical protein ADUPG1_013575 [Aduncisulcus paluster]